MSPGSEAGARRARDRLTDYCSGGQSPHGRIRRRADFDHSALFPASIVAIDPALLLLQLFNRRSDVCLDFAAVSTYSAVLDFFIKTTGDRRNQRVAWRGYSACRFSQMTPAGAPSPTRAATARPLTVVSDRPTSLISGGKSAPPISASTRCQAPRIATLTPSGATPGLKPTPGYPPSSSLP